MPNSQTTNIPVMPQSSTGWSVDTLREHFEARLHEIDLRNEQRYQASQQALTVALAALEKAMQTALASADRAVSKAETAAEKRFDSVNEFRGLVADQQRTLMPRSEAELAMLGLTRRVDAIEKAQISNAGEKTGTHAGWIYAIGAATLFSTVLAIALGIVVILKH